MRAIRTIKPRVRQRPGLRQTHKERRKMKAQTGLGRNASLAVG